MFTSLRIRLPKKWFDLNARPILHTAPIKCDGGRNLVFLSQLHHPDVLMYLVAAKSFARFIQPREFVIVDDGLLARDRDLLQRHFERIRFLSSRSVDAGVCPRGGCWERLLSISDINGSDYVVQLDADTVTLNEPTEVIEHIDAGRSFTLGTPGGESIVSTEETSRIASTWTSSHVQVLSERAMVDLPRHLGDRYVHGCAGFTGFRPGSLPRIKIDEFSGEMSKLLGTAKWSEWGSEQVTSNFLVANDPGAAVLPIDRYPFWKAGKDISSAALVHFFGTHRFEEGRYIKSAKQVIDALNDGLSPTRQLSSG